MYFQRLLFIVFFSFIFCPVSFGQGNGSDGALNITAGSDTIDKVSTAITGSNPIGNTITVVNTSGFSVGDAVLVMQMDGTNAGYYDELTISALTATSFTLSGTTTYAYSGVSTDKAQVIRIPQYTSVNVSSGATLTAVPWNGATGGVLIYYANGNTNVDGTVSMTGSGFTGGTGGAGSAAGVGGGPSGVAAGHGATSSGMSGGNASPFSSSGGNGGAGAGRGGAGGGGGNTGNNIGGTSGTGQGAGSSGISGTNLSSGITKLNLGGGGGGGQGGGGGGQGGAGGGGGAASVVSGFTGSGLPGNLGSTGGNSTGTGGAGGTGGGIVLIQTNTFSGTGTVASNGINGGNAIGTGGNGGNGGSGGGGGSNTNSSGGGGGGGGAGGIGGIGPGGAGAGGAGVIVIQVQVSSTWSGSASSYSGAVGYGGLGGSNGYSGMGGFGGIGSGGGTSGVTGSFGYISSLNGPTGPAGTVGAISQAPLIIIGALPIQLVSFADTALENKIIISWQTASEKNNSFFTVEKSTNGRDFQELCRITGAINSSSINSYHCEDLEPIQGKNYYRLKQTDINGHEQTFEIISVRYDVNEVLQLYPNPPGEDRIVHLSLIMCGSINEIILYNNLNQIVAQDEGLHLSMIAKDEYVIQLSPQLTAGLYHIVVNTTSQVFNQNLLLK